MLKKQTLLIDKESGDEWKINARTVGDTVTGPDGSPMKLYVYVLLNDQMHRRFVYEHLVENEFEVKS